MDNTKYQYAGMKWLVELELVNHPQVINTIRFNILMVSNRIKEVEILMFRENKSMLVQLNLTWIGRRFFGRRILTEVQDILTQLLPSFKIRVIQDPKIMELAIAKVKKALTGGTNENVDNINSSSRSIVQQPSQSDPISVATVSITDGITKGDQPSQQEQSVTSGAVLSYVSSNGLEKK